MSNSTHYNSVSSYSTLLSDNNVRDFLTGPPFGHTNSPPVQVPPPNQGFVGTRSMNSFVNPTKIYVANNGQTTTANDWPTNNTDLLNTINSTSPLHMPNAFNSTVMAPVHQQPMPLNYNVPPPPIGKFAPNFAPPTILPLQDFRLPPPRTNFNPMNGRNQPLFTNPAPNNPHNNGSRQQQRRSSQNGHRQNSSPIIAAASPFWNGGMKSNPQQQTFGLF